MFCSPLVVMKLINTIAQDFIEPMAFLVKVDKKGKKRYVIGIKNR